MHGEVDHPDPGWVRWAEAESIRRLKIALEAKRAAREAQAEEGVERALAGWDPEKTQDVVALEPVEAPAPRRIIKVHAENLLGAH